MYETIDRCMFVTLPAFSRSLFVTLPCLQSIAASNIAPCHTSLVVESWFDHIITILRRWESFNNMPINELYVLTLFTVIFLYSQILSRLLGPCSLRHNVVGRRTCIYRLLELEKVDFTCIWTKRSYRLLCILLV